MTATEAQSKPTLTIIRSAQCYLVKHSDPSIKDLFGTDTLPTPFFHSMPVEKVLAEITRLNPDCVVLIG